MENYAVILFFSNNHAIWAARIFKKADIEHKMISVPRHLSSDCGYCVRIKNEDITDSEELLKSREVEYDSIEKM